MLPYLISLPTSLVLGIVGNLMTPVVRNRIAASSAARRSERIARISKDIAFIERLRAQPSAATAYVCRKMIQTLMVLMLTGVINTAALVLLNTNQSSTDQATVLGFIGPLALLLSVLRVQDVENKCHSIYAPRWYATKTTAQLRKLGAELAADSEFGSNTQEQTSD